MRKEDLMNITIKQLEKEVIGYGRKITCWMSGTSGFKPEACATDQVLD